MRLKKIKICVIGLGYVGAPLLNELIINGFDAKGYDISKPRILSLLSGHDQTSEISKKDLKNFKNIVDFNYEILDGCNIFIVTTPTPIDSFKVPDLNNIIEATKTISQYVKDKSIIIYESTVYPGLTEEICVPIIKKISNLNYINNNNQKKGFHIGYSPERINPGDKKHTLKNTIKIISGSSSYSLKIIESIYSKITKAGIYKAKSIKIAESAKIIENIQRDVNVALINELYSLFTKMDINFYDVLEAANTKWNFLPFTPGLVGGHCIGVDPYYLTHKAKQYNYTTEMILSGRKINDSMPDLYADQIFKGIIKNCSKKNQYKILFCGITFKENCPDVRNSKVIEIIDYFTKLNFKVDIFDPEADLDQLKRINNLKLINKNELNKKKYDSIVFAVAHDKFKKYGINYFTKLCNKKYFLFDIKNLFNIRN